MADKLTCEKCGAETTMPMHCNRPMHQALVNGHQMLVCWMGPGCGVIDIPQHCGESMHQAA
jgi:hypothetical protein